MSPNNSRDLRSARGRSARVGGALPAFLCLVLLVALAHPPGSAADGAVQSGYAALVRRVAPSVVTVMVEEKRVSAGQLAAERVNPDAGADAVG